MTIPPRADRPFDLVLLGATGFTGRLVAHALAAEPGRSSGSAPGSSGRSSGSAPGSSGRSSGSAPGSSGPLRWALAGRDRARLAGVRAELAASHPERPALAELPLLLADSGDAAGLGALARQTRVVCTTVGPYDRLGEPLVAACVEAGTDCCDLTGEVPFMARTIARYHARARETGARVVHACGFDSIPSDLGCLQLQRLVQQRFGRPAARVRFALGRTRGGFSGGTVASMMAVAERLPEPGMRRLLADPWALAGEDHPRSGQRGPRDIFPPRRDAASGRWEAPFLMAPVNTRVVRRSAALLGQAWGPDFCYEEVVDCGRGLAGRLRATALTASLAGGGLALSHAAGRALARRFLPAPGEGPSEAARASGFWRARVLGWLDTQHDGPPDAILDLSGEGDPGYASTSRMLAACALSLAFDPPTPEGRAGVLTPAAAFGSGSGIWPRLARAGVRFTPAGPSAS